MVITMFNGTDTKTKSTIKLLAEELYYFDKDNTVQLLVKDQSDPSVQFEQVCGSKSKYAIGLTTFGKRELVFKYFGKSKFQIGIQPFEPTYLYLIILLILASLLLVFFIIACLFTLVMKCREEKDIDVHGSASTLSNKRQRLMEGNFNNDVDSGFQ